MNPSGPLLEHSLIGFPRQSGEAHLPATSFTRLHMGIRQIDLLQGTLDLLILKSLSTGANQGMGSPRASISCQKMC